MSLCAPSDRLMCVFGDIQSAGPEAAVARRREIREREIIWFNLVYKLSDSYNSAIRLNSVKDISLFF